MTHTVEFTHDAAAQLETLPKRFAAQVLRKIESLTTEPRPAQARRLTEHEHLYRLRSGDNRILYQIEDRRLLVLVVKIGHRKDVYRRIQPPGTETDTDR